MLGPRYPLDIDSDEEALDEEELPTSSFGPPGEDTPDESERDTQPNPTPSVKAPQSTEDKTRTTTKTQKQFEEKLQNKISTHVMRSKS